MQARSCGRTVTASDGYRLKRSAICYVRNLPTSLFRPLCCRRTSQVFYVEVANVTRHFEHGDILLSGVQLILTPRDGSLLRRMEQ